MIQFDTESENNCLFVCWVYMQVLFASLPNLWKYDAKSWKIRICIAEFRLWRMKFLNVFANIPPPSQFYCNKLGHFIEIKATILNIIFCHRYKLFVTRSTRELAVSELRGSRVSTFYSADLFFSRLKCELSLLLLYLLVLIYPLVLHLKILRWIWGKNG